MKRILVLCISLFGFTAQAQEFGAIGGIHQGKAEVSDSAFSEESVLSYRLGIVVKTELTDALNFRSGLLYTDRKMEFESSAPQVDVEYNFAYLDVPVLFDIDVNEMFSVFAGPIVAFNINKNGQTSGSVVVDGDVDNTNSIYLLAQVGASFTFDLIGFDVYFERGLGEMVDDGAENYMAFGANFLFWF